MKMFLLQISESSFINTSQELQDNSPKTEEMSYEVSDFFLNLIFKKIILVLTFSPGLMRAHTHTQLHTHIYIYIYTRIVYTQRCLVIVSWQCHHQGFCGYTILS